MQQCGVPRAPVGHLLWAAGQPDSLLWFAVLAKQVWCFEHHTEPDCIPCWAQGAQMSLERLSTAAELAVRSRHGP